MTTKHKAWIKIIAMAVVCAFTINNVAWAYPDFGRKPTDHTLQVPSMFKPILDVAGWKYDTQVRVELACILSMALKDEMVPFQDINSELDKWLSAVPTIKRKRLLNVLSNPQKEDEETVVDLEIFNGPKKGKKFRIKSTCESIADIQRDASKVRIEELSDEPDETAAVEIESPVVGKLKEVLGEDLRGKKVLELGIGTDKRNIVALAKAGAEVTAVDINESSLVTLKEILKKKDINNVALKPMDFNAPFTFADGEFDAIVFRNILDFVPDDDDKKTKGHAWSREAFLGFDRISGMDEIRERAIAHAIARKEFFKECRRVLRSGGLVVAEDIADPEYEAADPKFGELMAEFFEIADIGKAATAAGFHIMERNRSFEDLIMVLKSRDASQIGKRAIATRTFEISGRKHVSVIDAEDRNKVLKERMELFEADPGKAKRVLKEFMRRKPACRRTLEMFLELLENSPPKLYCFKRLIKDLFGFISVGEKHIALHEDLINNPVALFHEIGEYLNRSYAIDLKLAKGSRDIDIRILGSDRIVSVHLSPHVRKWLIEKGEKWPTTWKKDPHYLLRAVQLEFFGKGISAGEDQEDLELTRLIQDRQKTTADHYDISGPFIADGVKYYAKEVNDPKEMARVLDKWFEQAEKPYFGRSRWDGVINRAKSAKFPVSLVKLEMATGELLGIAVNIRGEFPFKEGVREVWQGDYMEVSKRYRGGRLGRVLLAKRLERVLADLVEEHIYESPDGEILYAKPAEHVSDRIFIVHPAEDEEYADKQGGKRAKNFFYGMGFKDCPIVWAADIEDGQKDLWLSISEARARELVEDVRQQMKDPERTEYQQAGLFDDMLPETPAATPQVSGKKDEDLISKTELVKKEHYRSIMELLSLTFSRHNPGEAGSALISTFFESLKSVTESLETENAEFEVFREIFDYLLNMDDPERGLLKKILIDESHVRSYFDQGADQEEKEKAVEDYLLRLKEALNGWVIDELVGIERAILSNEKVESFLSEIRLMFRDIGEISAPYDPTMFAGRYKLEKLLGTGAYSRVFKAKDIETGLDVTMRMLRYSSSNDLRRKLPSFLKGYCVMKYLGGVEGVVKGVDICRWDRGDGREDFFMVTKFIPGGSLYDLIKSGRRFAPDEAVALAKGVLQIIEKVQAKRIVHTDMKPANILLPGKDGKFDFASLVFLVDFDLALHLPEGGEVRINDVRGSPEYLPWEAFPLFEDGRYNESTDVYGLGIILYNVLTGRTPFRHDGGNIVEYFTAKSRVEPADVRDVAKREGIDVPDALADFIMKCIRRDPSYRFRSVGEAIRYLEEKVTPSSQGGKRAKVKEPELARAGLDKKVANPFPGLASGTKLTVRQLTDVFLHKYLQRVIYRGGPIAQPEFFDLCKGEMNDLDFFKLVSEGREFNDVVNDVLSGEIKLPLVFKLNQGALGDGIFFIEWGEEGRIVVTIATGTPYEIDVWTKYRKLPGIDITVHEEQDIMRLVIDPDEADVPSVLSGIREIMVSPKDSGTIETAMPVARYKGKAYETRHSFKGNLSSGNCTLTHAGDEGRDIGIWSARIGSSGKFANLTERLNARKIEGEELYDPLYEMFNISGKERDEFKNYADDIMKRQFAYAAKRLKAAGIDIDIEVRGQFDLMWMAPERGKFPIPVLIESSIWPFSSAEWPKEVIVKKPSQIDKRAHAEGMKIREDSEYYSEVSMKDGSEVRIETPEEAEDEAKYLVYAKRAEENYANIGGKAIRVVIEKGVHLSGAIVQIFLEKALERSGGDVNNLPETLVIAMLDSSPYMFEDHIANGFIGINRAINDIEDEDTRITLQKVGLIHEFSHELTGRSDDEFERGQIARDVELCVEELDNDKAKIVDLCDRISMFIDQEHGFLARLQEIAEGAGRQSTRLAFPDVENLEIIERDGDSWRLVDTQTGRHWYMKADRLHSSEKTGYLLAEEAGVNVPAWTTLPLSDLAGMKVSEEAAQYGEWVRESMQRDWENYRDEAIPKLFEEDDLLKINVLLTQDINEMSVDDLVQPDSTGIEELIVFLIFTSASDISWNYNAIILNLEGMNRHVLFDLASAGFQGDWDRIIGEYLVDPRFILDGLRHGFSVQRLLNAIERIQSINIERFRERVLKETGLDLDTEGFRRRQEVLEDVVARALQLSLDQDHIAGVHGPLAYGPFLPLYRDFTNRLLKDPSYVDQYLEDLLAGAVQQKEDLAILYQIIRYEKNDLVQYASESNPYLSYKLSFIALVLEEGLKGLSQFTRPTPWRTEEETQPFIKTHQKGEELLGQIRASIKSLEDFDPRESQVLQPIQSIVESLPIGAWLAQHVKRLRDGWGRFRDRRVMKRLVKNKTIIATYLDVFNSAGEDEQRGKYLTEAEITKALLASFVEKPHILEDHLKALGGKNLTLRDIESMNIHFFQFGRANYVWRITLKLKAGKLPSQNDLISFGAIIARNQEKNDQTVSDYLNLSSLIKKEPLLKSYLQNPVFLDPSGLYSMDVKNGKISYFTVKWFDHYHELGVDFGGVAPGIGFYLNDPRSGYGRFQPETEGLISEEIVKILTLLYDEERNVGLDISTLNLNAGDFIFNIKQHIKQPKKPQLVLITVRRLKQYEDISDYLMTLMRHSTDADIKDERKSFKTVPDIQTLANGVVEAMVEKYGEEGKLKANQILSEVRTKIKTNEDHGLQPLGLIGLEGARLADAHRGSPTLPKSDVSHTAAAHLLSVFEFEDALVSDVKRDDERGLSVYTIDATSDPMDIDAPVGGLSILKQELARTDRFDLLYNSKNHLIAVFPRFDWPGSGYYYDFSDYYVSKELLKKPIGDSTLSDWKKYVESRNQDKELIEYYKKEYAPAGAFKRRLDGTRTPFFYAMIGPGLKRPVLQQFDPEEFFDERRWRDYKDNWQKNAQASRAIFMNYPSVYPPAKVDHKVADFGFVQNVYDTVLNSDLKAQDKFLDVGTGTGLLVWVAWTAAKQRGLDLDFYAVDINPLAVKNAALLAEITGIPLTAKTYDNLISRDGIPAFPGTRFRLIATNTPTYRPMTVPRVQFSDYWDYDSEGAFFRRFAKGLFEVMEPNGMAMAWNWIRVPIDPVEMIIGEINAENPAASLKIKVDTRSTNGLGDYKTYRLSVVHGDRPSQSPEEPGDPQIGKRARLEMVSPDKSSARAIDSKGNRHVIELTQTEPLNMEVLGRRLAALAGNESHYRDVIYPMLLRFAQTRVTVHTFRLLVEDLFAFTSPENKMMAFYKALAGNPVAEFHEIGEYLIASGGMQLSMDSGYLVISFPEQEPVTMVPSTDTMQFVLDEDWDEGWEENPHYLLRILQREMFGASDEVLSDYIKKNQQRIQLPQMQDRKTTRISRRMPFAGAETKPERRKKRPSTRMMAFEDTVPTIPKRGPMDTNALEGLFRQGLMMQGENLYFNSKPKLKVTAGGKIRVDIEGSIEVGDLIPVPVTLSDEDVANVQGLFYRVAELKIRAEKTKEGGYQKHLLEEAEETQVEVNAELKRLGIHFELEYHKPGETTIAMSDDVAAALERRTAGIVVPHNLRVLEDRVEEVKAEHITGVYKDGKLVVDIVFSVTASQGGRIELRKDTPGEVVQFALDPETGTLKIVSEDAHEYLKKAVDQYNDKHRGKTKGGFGAVTDWLEGATEWMPDWLREFLVAPVIEEAWYRMIFPGLLYVGGLILCGAGWLAYAGYTPVPAGGITVMTLLVLFYIVQTVSMMEFVGDHSEDRRLPAYIVSIINIAIFPFLPMIAVSVFVLGIPMAIHSLVNIIFWEKDFDTLRETVFRSERKVVRVKKVSEEKLTVETVLERKKIKEEFSLDILKSERSSGDKAVVCAIMADLNDTIVWEGVPGVSFYQNISDHLRFVITHPELKDVPFYVFDGAGKGIFNFVSVPTKDDPSAPEAIAVDKNMAGMANVIALTAAEYLAKKGFIKLEFRGRFARWLDKIGLFWFLRWSGLVRGRITIRDGEGEVISTLPVRGGELLIALKDPESPHYLLSAWYKAMHPDDSSMLENLKVVSASLKNGDTKMLKKTAAKALSDHEKQRFITRSYMHRKRGFETAMKGVLISSPELIGTVFELIKEEEDDSLRGRFVKAVWNSLEANKSQKITPAQLDILIRAMERTKSDDGEFYAHVIGRALANNPGLIEKIFHYLRTMKRTDAIWKRRKEIFVYLSMALDWASVQNKEIKLEAGQIDEMMGWYPEIEHLNSISATGLAIARNPEYFDKLIEEFKWAEEDENRGASKRKFLSRILVQALKENTDLLKMVLTEIAKADSDGLKSDLTGAMVKVLRGNSDMVGQLACSLREIDDSALAKHISRDVMVVLARADIMSEVWPTILDHLDVFCPHLVTYGEQLKTHNNILSAQIVASLITGDISPDFLFSDNNEVMIIERVSLAAHLCKVSDLGSREYVLGKFEDVSHDEKLHFIRRLNNILSKYPAEKIDSLKKWRILLEHYIADFGFLANHDLIDIYMCLYQGWPLSTGKLRKYALHELNVTSTGQEGIEQLKRTIIPILTDMLERRDIDEKYLGNSVMKAFVGQATGFNTAQWGHGSHKHLDLERFVRDFHRMQKRIPSLDAAMEKTEGSFEVKKKGKVDFTDDERNAFERFSGLMHKALNLSEKEDALEQLREKAISKIQKELANMESRIGFVESEGGRKVIMKQIGRHKKMSSRLKKAGSPVEIIVQVVQEINLKKINRELQELIILCLLVETFKQYPQQKKDVAIFLEEGLSVAFIDRIIELKRTFWKEHILLEVGKKDTKKILSVFRITVFEKARARQQDLMDVARVDAFLTKGILGEMAGDIGDACYTSVNDLMRWPSMVGAVIFTHGKGLEKELVGSILLLENSINGEKTWIMRAINPKQDFIAEYSAEDFINGTIEYVKELAKVAGVKHIVVPINSPGSLTNRHPISVEIRRFVSGDTVVLDKQEALNGNDLKNTCQIIWTDESVEKTSPVEELIPVEKKIAEVEPIQGEHILIVSREDLARFIEEPLLEACEMLYDKGVHTFITSANRNNLPRWGFRLRQLRNILSGKPRFGDEGFAYITIQYDHLTEENKAMVDGIIEGGGKREGMFFEKFTVTGNFRGTCVNIWIPLKKNSTVKEISAKAVKIAELFKAKEPEVARAGLDVLLGDKAKEGFRELNGGKDPSVIVAEGERDNVRNTLRDIASRVPEDEYVIAQIHIRLPDRDIYRIVVNKPAKIIDDADLLCLKEIAIIGRYDFVLDFVIYPEMESVFLHNVFIGKSMEPESYKLRGKGIVSEIFGRLTKLLKSECNGWLFSTNVIEEKGKLLHLLNKNLRVLDGGLPAHPELTEKVKKMGPMVTADTIVVAEIKDPEKPAEVKEEEPPVVHEIVEAFREEHIEAIDGGKEARKIESMIKGTGRNSQRVLKAVKKYLSGISDGSKEKLLPVDIVVDLSLISKEDVDENAETWSYLIRTCAELKNVNFIFEFPDISNKGSVPAGLTYDISRAANVSEFLEALGRCLDREHLKRVNKKRRKDAIEISIMQKRYLEWQRENDEELKANQFPVALDGFTTINDKEVALRNFEAALAIGLSKASLVIAKRRDDGKDEDEEKELPELREKLLERLQKLYATFREDVMLTEKTLDNMIHPASAVRMNLAISLALPPITRMFFNRLRDHHDKLQLFLLAA